MSTSKVVTVDGKRPNRLREIRAENNIVQQQIVVAGKFSMSTINQIESWGYYPEDVKTREKLIRALFVVTGVSYTEEDIWPDTTETADAS